MEQLGAEDPPEPRLFDYLWFYGFIYGVMVGMVLFIIVANPEYTLFSKDGAFGIGYSVSVTTISLLIIREL